MNKRIIHSGISALLLFGLLVGCIKEDLSNCFRGVVLTVTCSNFENEDILSESIENLSVYIFDSSGKYVKTVTESIKEIESTNYNMYIPMETAGLYKIITLGDVDIADYTVYSDEGVKRTRSLIPSVSHIDDFRIQLKYSEDNIINRELGDFFIAESQEIEFQDNRNLTYNADLVRNNKLIRFSIDGLSSVEPVIRCKNSLYDKENNTPDISEEIIYKPYSSDDEKGIYLTSTLRIVETIRMPLTIEQVNGYLKGNSYDLVELIQRNPKYNTQELLDREDTFDIAFKYDGSTVVSITVNDWEVINVTPRP